MKLNRKYFILPALVMVFIASQLFLKDRIARQPEYREIMASNPFQTLPPAEYLSTYVSTLALGGFKPLLVDYLWMKLDKLQADKQFEEIRLLLSIIARLQPRLPAVWSFNAYHMIYNIAAQENTPQARWDWVRSGMDYIKEGMLYNPESPDLVQWLAFFYYHRISQEAYFIRQVESAEGTDHYDLAGKWYQKAIELYHNQNKPDEAALYGVMYLACRFRHSFELLKKGRFEPAVDELSQLESSALDPVEKARLSELISVLKYDREVSGLDVRHPDFIPAHSALLERYARIIDNHLGYDFKPINGRVENILVRYIGHIYRLIDNSGYNDASGTAGLLRIETDKTTPKLDSHPARWYYLTLIQRFEKLEILINAEAYLRKEGIRDFNADVRGRELIALYEDYLRKYSAYWLMEHEQNRMQKLMGK